MAEIVELGSIEYVVQVESSDDEHDDVSVTVMSVGELLDGVPMSDDMNDGKILDEEGTGVEDLGVDGDEMEDTVLDHSVLGV